MHSCADQVHVQAGGDSQTLQGERFIASVMQRMSSSTCYPVSRESTTAVGEDDLPVVAIFLGTLTSYSYMENILTWTSPILLPSILSFVSISGRMVFG